VKTLDDMTAGGHAHFMAPSAPRVPVRALFGAIVTAGAVVLAIAIVDVARAPIARTWFVLLALTVVSGWSTLRMRSVPISFSMSDTFTIAGTLLYGVPAGTVLAVVDALAMSMRVAISHKGGMAMRAVFNASSTALAMWLAGSSFFALSGTGPLVHHPGVVRDVIGPLALFAAMYFLLNTGFVAIAVANERHAAIISVWREYLSTLWLAFFSGASMAAVLVLMTVANVVDITTLVLVLPLLVILHVTYRAALDRMAERVEHSRQLALYAEGLRSTGDGVLMTDRNAIVTFINPAAEALLGRGFAASAGRPAAEVFRVVDVETRQPVEYSGGGAREYLLQRTDGLQVSIEARHAVIPDPNGDTVGRIVTFHDISARKAIEAEREALLRAERIARERADAAGRVKDEFLATISHELRTPATGILGWVRLLKTGRMDAHQARQAIEALERGAQAQAHLLEDLLDISRIVHGTLRVTLAPTDLGEVLAAALETVTPAIRAKRITLVLDIDRSLSRIPGDADRLRQVFWNLLSNAAKFTRAGGSIRVTARVVDDAVQVSVVDNGEGIDPDALPFIFDRFRQGDSSTTRSHGGLGLGLAIARHLIELHGGAITAHSEGRGTGARFEVRLPIAAAV
jgi:PAS domain S-box-containing protein